MITSSIIKPNNLFYLALALCLAVFGTLAGKTHWWHQSGLLMLPAGSYMLILSGLLLIVSVFKQQTDSNQTTLAAMLVMLMVFSSDWLTRGYSLFQAPSIRGEIILLAIIAYFFLLNKQANSRVWLLLLILSVAATSIQFLITANGRQLFSDDHSVFAYRLEQLVEVFPYIPFYNPLWDGGLDARDAFATGSLGLFVLALPFIYFVPVEIFYNFLIVWIVFIQLPLGTYLAARLLNSTQRAAALSGLLTLTCSLHWYRWALKYGTMGFINGASILTLVLVLGVILVTRSKVNFWHFVFFIATYSLCLFWPFYAVVTLPLVLFVIYKLIAALNQNKQEKWLVKRICVTVLILALVNLPWITLFSVSSGIIEFLQSNKVKTVAATTEQTISLTGTPDDVALKAEIEAMQRKFRKKNDSINLRESLKVLRTIIFSSHPVLIFFGLIGFLYLSTQIKIFWILQTGWVFIMGAIFYPVKPQLELDRMLLIMLILLALPAGLALDHAFEYVKNSRYKIKAWLLALTLGFVMTGPLVVLSIVKNRSIEQYTFADNMVNDFIFFLKEYKPVGRILFSGCVIHEFSGGHLAPLPYHTGHAYVASSRAHTLWWYKDMFPSEFLMRGDQGKVEFMDLYNASDIFAHEKRWKKYFSERPDQYELITSLHGFDLFRRKNYQSNYFIDGAGTVFEQGHNLVKMQLATESATIKFRYNAALTAGRCKIEPVHMYEEIDFIRLSDCGDQPFVLKALNPWQQLFVKDRKPIQ